MGWNSDAVADGTHTDEKARADESRWAEFLASQFDRNCPRPAGFSAIVERFRSVFGKPRPPAPRPPMSPDEKKQVAALTDAVFVLCSHQLVGDMTFASRWGEHRSFVLGYVCGMSNMAAELGGLKNRGPQVALRVARDLCEAATTRELAAEYEAILAVQDAGMLRGSEAGAADAVRHAEGRRVMALLLLATPAAQAC